MKPYRTDPSAPSHLRKLVESARRDDLQAARKAAVAAKLGLIPGAAPRGPAGEGGAGAGALPSAMTWGMLLSALALIGGGVAYLGSVRTPGTPDATTMVAMPIAAAAAPAGSALAPAEGPSSPSASPAPAALPPMAAMDVTALPNALPKAGLPAAPARAAPPLTKPAEVAGGDPGDLRLEVLALDNARHAGTAEGPRAALSALDDYARRFPKGKLREEALVLRIEALHASGDQAAADTLAQRFLRDAPNTPYAARVRAAITAPSEER